MSVFKQTIHNKLNGKLHTYARVQSTFMPISSVSDKIVDKKEVSKDSFHSFFIEYF